MDAHLTSEFLVSVIDDKAALIESLGFTDKEAEFAWASFADAIHGLYIFMTPPCVEDALRKHRARFLVASSSSAKNDSAQLDD